MISLKISVPEHNQMKTMQFPTDTLVMDACRMIKDKITETYNSMFKNDPNPCKKRAING